MTDCIFCRIVAGEIPSRKVYEDEHCYAFHDIAPQAAAHIVLVSKQHVSNLTEAAALTDAQLAALMRAASKVAGIAGLENGYRLVSNCGADARQSVPHLHFHILGGEKLTEKMA